MQTDDPHCMFGIAGLSFQEVIKCVIKHLRVNAWAEIKIPKIQLSIKK